MIVWSVVWPLPEALARRETDFASRGWASSTRLFVTGVRRHVLPLSYETSTDVTLTAPWPVCDWVEIGTPSSWPARPKPSSSSCGAKRITDSGSAVCFDVVSLRNVQTPD